jgi:hypothetical protein
MATVWRNLNDIITFGRYKGRDVNSVTVIDPAYLMWVHNNRKINTYFTDDVFSKIHIEPARNAPRKKNKEDRVTKHRRNKI